MSPKLPKGCKRHKCDDCQAVRLHQVGPVETVTETTAGGTVTSGYLLCWTCSACGRSTPAGGFCCRKCGGLELRVQSDGNLKRSRPRAQTRRLRCATPGCTARCETEERIIEWISG
jgi:hypothetical protein